jgi:hypothetical protein
MTNCKEDGMMRHDPVLCNIATFICGGCGDSRKISVINIDLRIKNDPVAFET